MSRSNIHSTAKLLRQNLRIVKQLYPSLPRQDLLSLRDLTQKSRLSIANGEILYLGRNWYVAHAGLLQIARRKRCAGIRTTLDENMSNPASRRWVFKAEVFKSPECVGFVGYGDADPSNVSPMVRGAEMRVAETRAVNRALRKAYGIGICSVEELGALSSPVQRTCNSGKIPSQSTGSNGNGNGQPKLRDRLCLLIRQHHLDPALVKRFATDFCHVPDLRQASREQVEALVKHLGEFAAKDPGGLAAKLNSFADKQEGAGAA